VVGTPRTRKLSEGTLPDSPEDAESFRRRRQTDRRRRAAEKVDRPESADLRGAASRQLSEVPGRDISTCAEAATHFGRRATHEELCRYSLIRACRCFHRGVPNRWKHGAPQSAGDVLGPPIVRRPPPRWP